MYTETHMSAGFTQQRAAQQEMYYHGQHVEGAAAMPPSINQTDDRAALVPVHPSQGFSFPQQPMGAPLGPPSSSVMFISMLNLGPLQHQAMTWQQQQQQQVQSCLGSGPEAAA
jgi:hypothetical protein